MTTFVIVHGAWGGGWEWSTVAELLREQGHRAFTPTLTGLGERAHQAFGETIGLSTHVDDVRAVLELEGLRDVVLCGASYGAMPAAGAADGSPGRVRLLVYVDGLAPDPGRSALDRFPDWFADEVRAGLAEHGPSWCVPMPLRLFDALVPIGSVPDGVRRDYLARIRPHPAASFVEPLRLTPAWDALPKAFIRCTTTTWADQVEGDPVAQGAKNARDAGWPYRELPVAHDPQLFDPEGVARLLIELGA